MKHGYGFTVDADCVWPHPSSDPYVSSTSSANADGVTLRFGEAFHVFLTPEQAMDLGKDLLIVGGYHSVFKARFGVEDMEAEVKRRSSDEQASAAGPQATKAGEHAPAAGENSSTLSPGRVQSQDARAGDGEPFDENCDCDNAMMHGRCVHMRETQDVDAHKWKRGKPLPYPDDEADAQNACNHLWVDTTKKDTVCAYCKQPAQTQNVSIDQQQAHKLALSWIRALTAKIEEDCFEYWPRVVALGNEAREWLEAQNQQEVTGGKKP